MNVNYTCTFTTGDPRVVVTLCKTVLLDSICISKILFDVLIASLLYSVRRSLFVQMFKLVELKF